MSNVNELAVKIQKDNKAWKTMTRAQRRVAVAKDVIKWLDQDKLVASSGTYLFAGYGNDDLSNLSSVRLNNPDGSFQDTLKTLPACEVCAKGAIFVCAVNRQNKVTNAETGNWGWTGEEMRDKLRGLFSARQLDLIEAEFEGSYGYYSRIMEKTMDCDDESRMRAIMRNIIKNKGTFLRKDERLDKTGIRQPLK